MIKEILQYIDSPNYSVFLNVTAQALSLGSSGNSITMHLNTVQVKPNATNIGMGFSFSFKRFFGALQKLENSEKIRVRKIQKSPSITLYLVDMLTDDKFYATITVERGSANVPKSG